MEQLNLFNNPQDLIECRHTRCYATMSCVPAGVACFDCGMIVSQRIPQPPNELGYMSADWAWHHVYGRDYICQEPRWIFDDKKTV